MDEKKMLYDELSRMLTEYEEGLVTGDEMYDMLLKIQTSWETVITAE